MNKTDVHQTETDILLDLSAKIIAAYVGNNSISSDQLPAIIKIVHSTLKTLHENRAPALNSLKDPAVPVKKSITDEYIICLEDGKKLKMMKRYLRARYNMSPQEYRTKWGLPSDYPMVSPNYAARRSDFAKINGLGKKGR
jgi:predicted transcriptional regulator